MELGTAANLISSGIPPLTWLQTVRLVCLLACVLLSRPLWLALSLQVLDVALGLCYLHTSCPSLVHGRLCSSTVLVSAALRAKLSTEVGGQL